MQVLAVVELRTSICRCLSPETTLSFLHNIGVLTLQRQGESERHSSKVNITITYTKSHTSYQYCHSLLTRNKSQALLHSKGRDHTGRDGGVPGESLSAHLGWAGVAAGMQGVPLIHTPNSLHIF